MMKNLLLSLLLCTALAGCDSNADDKGAGAGAPPAPKVTATRAIQQTVSAHEDFSGRFEAVDSVEIRSRVSGYLTTAEFQEGAIVKKGDILFVIDPRPYQAAFNKANADVNVAQSQIAFAQSTYDRAEALFKTGDISAQIRDQRLQARDQAVAELNRSKAAADQAKLDLAYTRIAAPITGRIGQKLVSEGNLVNPGETLLTTIVSMDPIYFYFDIDEQTYLSYTRSDASQSSEKLSIPAQIALSDETDFTHPGTIDFIDNAMNGNTGTMRARVVLANPDLHFTPGMFGRVRVTVGDIPNAVLIPDSAILIDQSRKYVYIVDDKGMAASRSIETGPLYEGNRVILKGLEGNENVITNGLQRVHDGVPVTIDAPAAAAPVEGAAPAEGAKPEEPAAPAADATPADTTTDTSKEEGAESK